MLQLQAGPNDGDEAAPYTNKGAYQCILTVNHRTFCILSFTLLSSTVSVNNCVKKVFSVVLLLVILCSKTLQTDLMTSTSIYMLN